MVTGKNIVGKDILKIRNYTLTDAIDNPFTTDIVLSTLPDKRYYEYAYHKFFTKGVEYNTWKPDATWDYPDRDILRFGQIITAQKQHIADKRILDLGCHIGYISLFCLYNNAEFVTGTNVRDRELGIANEICHIAGYDNYKFLNSTIDNTVELNQLCNTADTVFFCGLLYHLNNHMEVLKAIANSSSKTLIIETEIHARDPEIPSIVYEYEDSSDPSRKWEDNKAKVFVGTPNTLWIKTALQYVGYNVTYNREISYTAPHGGIKNRLIIVGIKE